MGPGVLPRVNESPLQRTVGLVCPHAGYMYSGPVAAHSFKALAEDGVPELVVLVGPNHSGYGAAVAVSQAEVWRTPLGDVKVDLEAAKTIVKVSGIAEFDDVAHMYEHSLEVQLPFLQYLYGSRFSIVPIAMMLQDMATCRDLAKGIVEALKGRNGLVIASTDFTHYEPHAVALKKDLAVIEAIEEMNAEKMMFLVRRHNVTMCGYGPVATAILACRDLGATQCRRLKYATSGDITGDYGEVVGYSSLIFLR